MKIFNTLQELWDYCEFCPICKEHSREIEITVGPDDNFKLHQSEKTKDYLKLQCSFISRRTKYAIDYTINCHTNECAPAFGTAEDIDKGNTKASAPYFYFYLFAECKKCKWSWINTSDIELPIVNRHDFSLSIEKEGLSLVSFEKKYQLQLDHVQNKLIIEPCTMVNDRPIFIPGVPANEFSIPLFDLDLTNQEKLYKKIRTILTFS